MAGGQATVRVAGRRVRVALPPAIGLPEPPWNPPALTCRIRLSDADPQRADAALFENAPDAILVFESGGRVRAMNGEARRLVGGRARAVVADLFVRDDRVVVADALARIETASRGRFEATLAGIHGPVPVEVAGAWDAGNGLGQLHLRDVSERRRMDQLKDDFISVVNHELRTPLTSISGALGLMLGGVGGELPEQARSLAEMAHANCQRLGRLINDMLDVQKMESGKVEFAMQATDLVASVVSAVAETRGFAARYDVALESELAVKKAEVWADPDRVAQVMANLLSNAVKYSPAGAAVTVRILEDEDNARVEVRDRGKGIPDEFKGRVFAKFAQADSSTTRKKGGTGLGLAISRAIVEGMGGAIGFESLTEEEETGTTFWFTLPLASTRSVPAGTRRAVLGFRRDSNVWPPSVAVEDCATVRALVARARAAERVVIVVGPEGAAEAVDAVRGAPELDDARVFVARASRGSRGPAVVEIADWVEAPLDPGALATAVRAVSRRLERRPTVAFVGLADSVASVNCAILTELAECHSVDVEGLTEAEEAPDVLVVDPVGAADKLADVFTAAQRGSALFLVAPPGLDLARWLARGTGDVSDSAVRVFAPSEDLAR